MKDRFIRFEADREDPLDEFESDLFRDRKWAVLIVLVGCALGAIALVIWR